MSSTGVKRAWPSSLCLHLLRTTRIQQTLEEENGRVLRGKKDIGGSVAEMDVEKVKDDACLDFCTTRGMTRLSSTSASKLGSLRPAVLTDHHKIPLEDRLATERGFCHSQ